ncbi:hypothetical protein BpHYR1_029963 [Brachionus plicatilis]|uniref:Uncharacterized protein n=1 Tax=Brachionus plicatilis TaxID=10195 RepID=A0A3M7P3P7_BRAPC|nr:hypothetical protein BpHYR1_029963 [Brachionus plicatilis]
MEFSLDTMVSLIKLIHFFKSGDKNHKFKVSLFIEKNLKQYIHKKITQGPWHIPEHIQTLLKYYLAKCAKALKFRSTFLSITLEIFFKLIKIIDHETIFLLLKIIYTIR